MVIEGLENYDGVTALNDYRGLFPSETIVSIGLESSPQRMGRRQSGGQ